MKNRIAIVIAAIVFPALAVLAINRVGAQSLSVTSDGDMVVGEGTGHIDLSQYAVRESSLVIGYTRPGGQINLNDVPARKVERELLATLTDDTGTTFIMRVVETHHIRIEPAGCGLKWTAQ